MGTLKEWRHGHGPSQWVPELAQQCVHEKTTLASCDACLDACPMQAIRYEGQGIAIDAELCDGCGLCAAACPTVNIQYPLSAAKGVLDGIKTLLLACEYSGATIPDGDGGVACVHALGERHLLGYYQQGFRRLILAKGFCSNCPRDPGVNLLADRVARINTLLLSRNVPAISCMDLDATNWSFCLSMLKPDGGPVVSRRDFFRRAAAIVSEQAESAPGSVPQEQEPWPMCLPIPQAGSQALYPFVPILDAMRCNGCDACASLCPYEAILLSQPPAALDLGYELAAARCTGCRLCLDVCDQSAVRLDCDAPQVQIKLSLVNAQCSACGNPFHYPDVAASPKKTCRICSVHNHHAKLFQVY